jgi:hypothetical protein
MRENERAALGSARLSVALGAVLIVAYSLGMQRYFGQRYGRLGRGYVRTCCRRSWPAS